VEGYPCLVDEGSSVGVQVVDTSVRAERLHALGVRRLLTLVNPSPVRWVVSHLGNQEKLALGSSQYSSVPELLEDAWLKASDRLLRAITDPVRVRDEQEFRRVAGGGGDTGNFGFHFGIRHLNIVASAGLHQK